MLYYFRIQTHQQNNQMTELDLPNQEYHDFVLMQQLKESEMQMLHFLFNAEFQNALLRFQEKTAVHIEMKKYQKSVSINPQEISRQLLVLSQKLHEKIIKEDYECYKALNKLQVLWEAKKIEPYHRYCFQKYLHSNNHLSNIMTLIKHEEQLMRQEHHVYFSIEKAIWAREACLNHLRREIKSMDSQDVWEHLQTLKDREVDRNRNAEKRMYKVYGYRAKLRLDENDHKLGQTKMEKLSEDINSYRKITCYLIELVSSWKLYMQSLNDHPKQRKEKLQYYYKNHNLFLTILNDASFIASSFLSQFYTFSTKNDPLILKPILNIEKKMVDQLYNFQTQQLKRILDCRMGDLPQIIAATEQLYREVEWNVAHQKYHERKLAPVKSGGLERAQSQGKLSSIKSISLNRGISNKLDPITSLARQKSQSLTRSNVLIRKSSINSQMSSSSIFSKPKPRNPENRNLLRLLQSQDIRQLKQQIYKKVKGELEWEAKRSIIESKEFAERIEEEVRVGYEEYLSNVEKQVLENHLEITALSFVEEDVGSFVTNIYKDIPVSLLEMQRKQDDILASVLSLSFSYILKVHTKKNEVANIIAFANHQNTQYKCVQIGVVAFKHPKTFQKVILKFVQFIWKYDNAKEIILNLQYHNQQTTSFVKQLQSQLQHNCTIIQKKYRDHIQCKFIFTNKALRKEIAYHPYQEKMHFKLYSALCVEQVKLEAVQTQNLSRLLHYDYLVMEILKRYTNSQDFTTLRDTFKGKDRLRFLLTQMMEIENHKDYEIEITTLSAQNLSELNHQLRNMKKPLLQASDLVKLNNIKMIQLEFTLTVAYQMKVQAYNNIKCHRYAINAELQYTKDSLGTQFYLLPVQESQHLKIIVFSADSYLKKTSKALNMYLFETLQRLQGKWNRKRVQNLWIEMLRYPTSFTERQSYLLTTHRSHQFAPIKKDLLLGDCLDWSSDMQIQNGLHYKPQKEDLFLSKPLGVGVITNKNWLLYCRIVSAELAENV